MYQLAILTLFPAAVTFAAAMDLLSYRIPNKISLFLIAAFLALAPFAGMTLHQFGGHLAAGAIVLVVTASLFFAGIIGGGDSKLVSAVALWVGMEHLVDYLLIATLLGGSLGSALLLLRTLPLPVFMAKEAWIQRLHAPRGDIPYGIALSAAGLYIYPHTMWFARLAI